MPTPDLFTKMGLFAANGFLEPEVCAKLRRELETARGQPATVYRGNDEGELNRTVRSTSLMEIAPETHSLINARLRALRPTLENHFHISLSGWESVNCLRYTTGDFFREHRDANPSPDAPEILQGRQVSIVIFLSEEGTDYGGGNLTFYGLMKDPRWERIGFPLRGERGLLVAFLSDVLHEVTPVTHGERLTLVTWYY